MTSRLRRTFHQRAADWYWRSRNASQSGLRVGVMLSSRLRRLLIASGDPTVTYQFHGTPLTLPFSHALPDIVTDHPCYSSNLGRVAGCIARKYPDIRVVDVGANVGDSAAILRRQGAFPMLCVEGSGAFAQLLRANTEAFDEVEIVNVYLSDRSGVESATSIEDRGTARLVGDGGWVATKTLDELLLAHPTFRSPKLIKIDTDGYDEAVIRGASHTLAAARPVLFFEFDPRFWPSIPAALGLFDHLVAHGYRLGMFWVNTGEYLVTLDLTAREQVLDLATYCTVRSATYLDCCAFHEEDLDVAIRARRAELDFFRAESSRQGHEEGRA